MRNKALILVLSIFALITFHSCEKYGADTLLPGANLSIRLSIDGMPMTRTAGSGTVSDLESESYISSLTICIINKADLNPSSPVLTVSDSNNLAWKYVSDGTYEVNAVIPDMCTGDCLLYVIANKPSWMTINTYADICGAFSGDAGQVAGCWAENNFLMVNKQNEITTSDDQAGVSVTMAPAGEKVTCAVTIERLASKIVVNENYYMEVAPLLTEVLCSGENPGVDPDIKGAIASMSIKSYALFNCVNSFNLIQNWIAATGSESAAKLLVSPSSNAGTLTDHSDAYSMSDGYYDNVPSSLVFRDLGTALYCMENNSPYYSNLVTTPGDATPGTKMKGRVTGLVFKAQAGFAKDFSGNVTVNEPLGIENTDVTWTRSGSSEIIYSTLYQYRGNYYGDLSCLLRNNSSLNGLGASPSVAQLRTAGVKVYEDGYMYYNYWIEDVNYTDNGRYYLSVMRNTCYDITITAINSMGDEFPCGGADYNASDPIFVDVPKLSISIDIPDWSDKTGNYVIQ